MGCDMVVALGGATVDGCTLFGQNSSAGRSPDLTGKVPAMPALIRCVGRPFSPGEKVRTDFIEIPQARQTHAVVASQPAGRWGYRHGVNEHGVAAGCTSFFNKLQNQQAGLTGMDLVRLVLERSHSACQGVDVLADLLERCGQGTFAGCQADCVSDHAILIADSSEAFLVETAGRYWAYQEIHQVRAASDVCTIHQDWDRIAPGLASYAIEQGWWPGDGSKIDFAGALCDNPLGEASALRRWGRATLLLEQQNGHIDAAFIRRVLSDHYEGTHSEVNPWVAGHGPTPLCQHGQGHDGAATAASMVANLGRPGRLPIVGCAFGPPCTSVYFPIFVDGSLPEPFSRTSPVPLADNVAGCLALLREELRQDKELANLAHERFAQMQLDFEQEAADVAHEGASLKLREEHEACARLTSSFMQHCLERFDSVVAELAPQLSLMHAPASR